MKLTIEIPDAHTGAVLEFVAALVAKVSPVEAAPDPAPGHPELPLDDEADRWFVPDDITAADPLKVAMEDSIEDTRPTVRPETGKTYRTRDGVEMKIVGEYDAEMDDFEGLCQHGTMYYRPTGHPRKPEIVGSGWDLVKEIKPAAP